jgi:lipoprotein-releasing system permease protein
MISVATGAGLQQKIRNKMSGFKGHIQITNYDNNNSDVSIFPVSKNQPFYPKFENIDGIKNVQVFANKTGLIRTKTDFEGIVFKGVSSDYDWTFFNEYLVEGRLPNFDQKRTRDILLSKTLVNRLNLKLNDTIRVSFFKSDVKKPPSTYKLVITGIYNTGFIEFDKNMMIGDIRQVRRLNRWSQDQVGGFEVILDDFDELRDKGNEIYQSIGSTLDAQTITSNYPAIFEWIELFDNNIWFIIAIMILVAGINMITALLVLILERIPMIGVLKSLGSSNWSIRKVFLYNASYLILKGLIWGNLIGLTLLFLQHQIGFITLDPENYYVSEVPVHLDIISIVLLNVGTLILCFLMLILPSFVITKIQPSKSIRFA